MNLTDFHAKYFAYELTKRSTSDSVEMLAGVLADAQVDLNPHQIDAALFAFRNPFSRGAILADHDLTDRFVQRCRPTLGERTHNIALRQDADDAMIGAEDDTVARLRVRRAIA